MPDAIFAFSTVRGPPWLQPRVARNRINMLHTRAGPVTYRGGGHELPSWWFDDEHYGLSSLMWFYVSRSEMRGLGSGFFLTAPVANFTGDLLVRTEGRSVFEEPALTWDMEIWQELSWGSSYREEGAHRTFSLVHEHRRSNVVENRIFSGDPFQFPARNIWIDRPDDGLTILLHIEFRFWRDASGHFWFRPLGDERFFHVDVPAWHINWSPASAFE